MKITNRFLSLLLAVAMVLSMVPAVSAAETEQTPATPTRGAALGASKTYTADEWIEVGTVTELKAAFGNGSGANAEANEGKVMGVRLKNDITVTKELDDNKTSGTMLYIGYILEKTNETITRDQDVVLDLNGYTLSTDETVKRSRLFGTYGNSSLVITNGTIVMDGTYTGYSSFCFLHKKNALTLDGVSVTQKDESARANYGGLLHSATGGTTITIINSDIVKEGGSVWRGGIINTGSNSITVTATNSTFTGGKVVGGTSTNTNGTTTTYHARGGQIYIASGSTLNATNCSFTGGVSASSDSTTYNSEGGNIFGYGTAKLNLTDCYVSGGTAPYGGNIGILGATLTLNGTTVSGGKATQRGGNIYALSNTTYKATAITMTDSTVENGDVTNTENVVVYGGNIYLDGGEDESGCKLTVNSGTITGGSVTAASTASSTYIGGGNIFGCNKATINLNGGEITDSKVYNEAATAALAAGGNIYVTTSSVLNIYDGVTISGGNIDSKVSSAARGGNVAYSGSTVNIYGGTIKGGEADRGGNLFSPTTSSKLNIYGGTIEGGNARSSYGGNISHNGTVKMYGGTFNGGTCSSANGKEIYVAGHKSAKFYIYGGSVLNTNAKSLYAGTSTANGNGTLLIYSGEFGANPQDTYVSSCSSESTANGLYYVTHNDVEGATTVTATCTEAGTKTIVCPTCKQTYTYEAPATGHTEVIDEAVAPDCTNTGLTEGKHCSVCGTVIEAQKEVAALGHTVEVIPSKAPTCTDTGLTEGKVCEICGETLLAQEEIAAAGHAWDEGVIDPKPTCNDAGVKTYTCTTCGETKTEAVEATGHTPVIDEAVAPDCTNTGLTEGSHCSVCDTVIVAQEVIAALGHTEEVVPGKAPTCTDTGLTDGAKCSVCGEILTAQEEIAALGHKYEGVYTEPTFEADAYTTYTCSVCGDSYTETHAGTKLTAAVEIGGTKYETLAAAVEAAQPGETITLLDDVVLTEQLTVAKTVTLDLNGFDITGDVAGIYGMIYVSVKGNLTVVSNAAVATFSTEGSEITNASGYAIGNYGTVSVENVALTGADAALYNFYYNGTTYGKATIGENATANIIWNSGELTVAGNADYIDNSGALTVTGTASEIYARGGSDAADVPGAGTITVANTSVVTVPDGYKLAETETAGVYKVTKLVPPNATVTEQAAMVLSGGEYMVWPSGDDTINRPLEIVVNFKAEDTLEECEEGGYSDWLTDFNLTVTGMSGDSIIADNCYLAGNYGSFGWIVIPTDGLELKNGVSYPVVSAYDASLNYKDICSSVKDFTAAIHIDQAILDANPNLEVKLELVMTNPENPDDKLYVGEEMVYTAEELTNIKLPPKATVSEQAAMVLSGGEYMVWPSGDDTINRPLEIVVNFKAEDTLEECEEGGYSDWLTDFNLTVTGMSGDSIIADNCYLAGNYGEFGWIVIPTDGLELENGVSYPVVSAYDASLNYKDICSSVKDFTAAIHIDQAILDANPDMEVKLELVMTNPENPDDKLYVGEEITYTAEELTNTKLPEAEVTPMDKVTLDEDEYRVWNGMKREPGITEDKALVAGEGKLPLEVVVNFKAKDTLAQCLAGGFSKWLVDFNVTIEGLEEGSFTADNCYLAGNYGSYGWIKIPLDGQTIEEGVTYPVVALYDPTLNYKDICKSVKDFTAAIHIDQAILDANPNLTVKLELVMTNPDNAEDTLQIGEDLIYGFEELRNDIVAKNLQTGKLYASVETALSEAVSGQTVKLLGDSEEQVNELLVTPGRTLDLNGYTLKAGAVYTFSSSLLIDSTNGDALLVVEKNGLAVDSVAPTHIPVWTEDGEVAGYRFTAVAFRQKATLENADRAYYRFYFAGAAAKADSMLAQEMKDGGEDNSITVQVKLTWTDANGVTQSKYYVYTETNVKEYAANWEGKQFHLYVNGVESVKDLTVSAAVVSSCNVNNKPVEILSEAVIPA